MMKFIPQKREKEIISIRIDGEVLSNIDSIATDIDISRNELINQCIEFALLNIDLSSLNKTNNIHDNSDTSL